MGQNFMTYAKNSLNGAAVTLCMTPQELQERLDSKEKLVSLKKELNEANSIIQELLKRNTMLEQNLKHFINKQNV
jgi:hypothetical protein